MERVQMRSNKKDLERDIGIETHTKVSETLSIES